nr:hypothetical protein BaRGS_026638 [Batillaria attramentaria]
MKSCVAVLSVVVLVYLSSHTLALSWPLLCRTECQIFGESLWCACSDLQSLNYVDKRGVRLPFRFGKRGYMEKRQRQPFRYGKRAADDTLSTYNSIRER